MPDIVPKKISVYKYQTVDEQLAQEQARNEELIKQKELQDLQEEKFRLDKEVNGDPNIATKDVSHLSAEMVDPLGSNINRNDYVATDALSVHDIHRTWIEENGVTIIIAIFALYCLEYLSIKNSHPMGGFL